MLTKFPPSWAFGEWPEVGGRAHTAEMVSGHRCRVRDPESREPLGSLPQFYFKPTFQIRFADASFPQWGIRRIMDYLYSMC